MDAQQFAKLEEEMLAEHQRELEMLRHLKERFVHGRNGSSASTRVGATVPRTTENRAKITIIDNVARIMITDPGQHWDAPSMKAHLYKAGMTVKATTINRVFRKLVKRGTIRRVRKGEGRTPNIYQGLSPKQEGQKAQMKNPEGD
jgi:hypothetical protein